MEEALKFVNRLSKDQTDSVLFCLPLIKNSLGLCPFLELSYSAEDRLQWLQKNFDLLDYGTEKRHLILNTILCNNIDTWQVAQHSEMLSEFQNKTSQINKILEQYESVFQWTLFKKLCDDYQNFSKTTKRAKELLSTIQSQILTTLSKFGVNLLQIYQQFHQAKFLRTFKTSMDRNIPEIYSELNELLRDRQILTQKLILKEQESKEIANATVLTFYEHHESKNLFLRFPRLYGQSSFLKLSDLQKAERLFEAISCLGAEKKETLETIFEVFEKINNSDVYRLVEDKWDKKKGILNIEIDWQTRTIKKVLADKKVKQKTLPNVASRKQKKIKQNKGFENFLVENLIAILANDSHSTISSTTFTDIILDQYSMPDKLYAQEECVKLLEKISKIEV